MRKASPNMSLRRAPRRKRTGPTAVAICSIFPLTYRETVPAAQKIPGFYFCQKGGERIMHMERRAPLAVEAGAIPLRFLPACPISAVCAPILPVVEACSRTETMRLECDSTDPGCRRGVRLPNWVPDQGLDREGNNSPHS